MPGCSSSAMARIGGRSNSTVASRARAIRILFVGSMASIEDVLVGADLFLLPSETESFGLAALEAMSCRSGHRHGEVVACRRSSRRASPASCGRWVTSRHGRCGALAAARPASSRAFGDAARHQAVERLGDAVVERYRELYRRVAENG